MRRLTAGLAGFAMLWVLAGCADRADRAERAERPAARAAAATTVAEAARPRPAAAVKQRGANPSGRQISLAVYYLHAFGGRRFLAPEWHEVPYTRAVATAALGELLGGRPMARGARRPFPAAAGLRSVELDEGTITVDLTATALPAASGPDRRWSLQALVHTVTQFPKVQRVRVLVEGRSVAGPLVRDPGLPLAPIVVMEPAAGALVAGDRLVVKGEASVYEGTVSLRLRDHHDRVVAQSYATAAEGAPGRGPFAGGLRFTPPAAARAWSVEAFEVSPENGQVLYSVRLPVWVGR
jgi:germination protein M